MRCTVIGGAGFVGRRLADTLRRAGHEVWVPARGDRALLTRDLGHVYYCAGLTADYAARPYDTVTAHVTLLADVLRANHYDHLVYLSSTRLYDTSQLPVGDEAAALTLQPANPRALYDFSKGLGENLCLTVAAGRTAVARLSCVFDWAPESPGFLSEWLMRAATERAFRLDSDSGFVRDYIHLDDVVDALVAISTRKAGGIFNVASGENVSNGDLAEVFNTAGWDIGLARRSPVQRAAECSTAALRALGVTPRDVRSVVAGYLEGGSPMEMIGQTRESLAAYTCAQVANLVPDGRGDALLPVVSRHIDEALARTGRCIDAVRMWRPGQFNYLHSSQYCQYLYYLANTIWRNERNGEACTKLFLLNKALNAIDLFYEIEMPEVFFIGHSVGIVLAKATYGNYLVLYQNSTVGKNHGVAPVIGDGVVMYPNTAIIGRSHVRDNSVVAQGVSVLNRETPGNCLVYAGQAGDLVCKPASERAAEEYFRV